MLKKIFTVSVVVMTIFWAVGLAAFVPTAQAAVASGSLIKASGAAVYYMGADGKRYVFPNEKTYMTWYPDFSGVITITDAELAAITIGGNVTMRPGVKMGKITTDPKVYAIGANGTLRWVTTEAIAVCLYGANWGTMVQDISDAFFVNYTIGAPINACSEFSPAAVTAAATSINVDKGLSTVIPPLAGGGVTVSVASDSPAGMLVPTGASVDVLHLTLAAGSLGANVSTIKLTSSGLGTSTNIDNVTLYTVSGAKIASAKNVTSDKEVTFSFGTPIAISANSSYTIVVRATFAANGYYAMGVKAGTDITTGGTNTGTFPVNGSTMQATDSVNVGTVGLTASTGGTPGTSHDFGEDNVLLAEFDLTANNEDVLWSSAMMKNGGSTGADLISNLKLIVDGVEVATGTYANDYVTFAINNYLIEKSETVSVEVRGDLGVGNDGDTVKLYIKDRADFEFIGQDYGFGAQLTTVGFGNLDNATTDALWIVLQTGQFAIDFDKVLTPTQDVKPDTQNVVLATLKLKSAGENATITAIADANDTTTQFEVGGTAVDANDLENFELVDVATGGIFSITETFVADRFNLSLDDELNLLQGVQKTYQLRADVTSTSEALDQFIVTLDALAITVTGDVSNADITDITPSSITSAATTVKDATLEVIGTALTATTIVPNTADVVIYQAQLKAGSADAVKITSAKISTNEVNANLVFSDTNVSALSLYLNGVLLKTVSNQIVEATGAAAATITFNSLATADNANVIPAGTTGTLVVKASFAGSFTLGTNTFITEIATVTTDVDSRAVVSNDAITETGVDGVNSRSITLAATGTISVDMRVVGPLADEDTYLLAGLTTETGRSLGEMVFKTTNEPVKVTALTLTNLGTTTNADLKLVKLVDGAGTVKASVTPDATGDAIFENMNLVFIADASTSLFLVVEANGINVDGVPSSTATDGTTAQFEIASVVAEGVNTSTAITVIADADAGAPEVNEFSIADSKTTTIVASKLNGVINGLTNGTLTGGISKIVGEYTFTFDNGANRRVDDTNFDAQMDRLLLTVSKSTGVVLTNFKAYIETSPATTVAANATTCAAGVTSCTATWNAGTLAGLSNLGLVDGTVTLVLIADVATTVDEYVQSSIANLATDFGYDAGENMAVIVNMLLPYPQVVGGTLSN